MSRNVLQNRIQRKDTMYLLSWIRWKKLWHGMRSKMHRWLWRKRSLCMSRCMWVLRWLDWNWLYDACVFISICMYVLMVIWVSDTAALCTKSCINGGKCNGKDSCLCTDEYEGERCENRKELTSAINTTVIIVIIAIGEWDQLHSTFIIFVLRAQLFWLAQ